ncbi:MULTISPECIES: CRISPR-associated protein Cas4 [unclassified Methanobrevibacter]|uniref:CRISPR-associated protein Cas4 n=1 Tax=unclassified Methanobrevibacter TaxID=2638681 RepID=UPI0025E71FEA|nr:MULTISPECIES: CRISPR-associated protein Cas4 [unclassified Methanobrevibacter]MEE0943422.1 CRISPR-associated protein Cas4 [Methanobrevibacter sp.]
MINISTIKTHMFCPRNLYIQTYVDKEEENNYQLAIEIKKLKIDIQDLIQKNLRKIKKEMELSEIEKELSENIDTFIKSNADAIISMNLDMTSDQVNEIIDNTYFNIKLTALKIKQAMNMYQKDAFAITDMFFPNCMYSYLLKDQKLELIGICDKIEIIDGKYYPVIIKSSNPPLKGVWDQDAIELVAHAILLEEEFETEVFVGFVYYEKIDEKRPVVMDVNLRKGLFEVIREVKEITENKKLPNVKMNPKKCSKCGYENFCLKG